MRISLALAFITAGFAAAQVPGFAPQTQIGTGVRGLASIRPIDMDGDGDLDVVACSPRDEEIVWFENDGGTANHRRHVISSSLLNPAGVAGADFDGDGDADLLITTRIQDDIWLITNLGGGEFADPVLLLDTAWIGSRIELTDLDGDGDVDVLIPSREGYPHGPGPFLIENLGGGALATPRNIIGVADGSSHLVPLDVDMDGQLDLVTAGPSSIAGWYRNEGHLSFSSLNLIDSLWFQVHQVELGDLDGDGDEDLVFSRLGSPAIVIFENLGGGTFGPRLPFDVGLSQAPAIAVADVDADGDLDVIAGGEMGTNPVWLENQGAFTFSLAGPIMQGLARGPRDIVTADFDGDARVDLLMGTDDDSIVWLRGVAPAPGGLAFEPTARTIATNVQRAADVVALDIDQDGDLDLATASPMDGLFIALQHGSSYFHGPVISQPSAVGVVELDAADLDGDGHEDLALRDTQNRVAWLPTGAGGLGASVTIDTFNAGEMLGPVLFDVDGDSDVDIVVGTPDDHSLLVYEQTAPGVFAPRQTLATGVRRFRAVHPGDVDGDGVLDLVVLRQNVAQQRLGWLRGLGNGQFAAQVLVCPSTADIREVGVADIDHDGDDEVFWITDLGGAVLCARLTPAGTFEAPITLASVGGRGRKLMVEDLNADGRVDLTLSFDPGGFGSRETVQWLRGFGALNFGGAVTLATNIDLCTTIEIIDLDGDGDQDIVTSSQRDDRVALFVNQLRIPFGVNYCGPAVANSTGQSGRMQMLGDRRISVNEVLLQALDLPAGSVGMFLTSRSQGFAVGPGGSAGSLCLGGEIGRYTGPGQVTSASQDGLLTLTIDLTAVPQPTGASAVLAGELWRFQAWYRDVQNGVPTSNFTDALAVSFL